MLDPKEIDTYFQAAPKPAKPLSPLLAKHSRKVMLAKLLLPSLAAVLVVMLLVFPSLKNDIKEFGLDFAITKGDIEKLNIEKTTMYLTDAHNKINTFSAKRINEIEPGSQKYTLIAPEAVIPMSDNEILTIKSPDGIFNQQTNILNLDKNVEAIFSKGMTIQTSKISFDFKKSFGKTNEPVTGSGYLGIVKAEGLEFYGKTNTLSFTGKTHIILHEEGMRKD